MIIYEYVYICFIIINTTFPWVQTENLFKKNKADEVQKMCRYRNALLTDGLFPVEADWGCYEYNRESLFINGRIPKYGCEGIKLPCMMIQNKPQIFHHSVEQIQNAVLKSFGSRQLLERWLRCCVDATNCCKNYIATIKEDDYYCPPLWDGWTCFPEKVEPGDIVESICSDYAYSGQGPRCNHFSYKTCFENGTWDVNTDYSTCNTAPRIITRTYWHISMLSISLIVCAPALLILCFYKQLRTQKYYLIRNLILAICARNAIVLMTKHMIVLDELTTVESTVMSKNNWPCKLLAFFEKLSSNAVFTCMLLEGFFLHQLLTNVFGSRKNSGPKMLYYNIIGAFISISSAIIWAILISINYDSNCWIITDEHNYHWINIAPRLLMLIINTFLLLHIIWILWKTFRKKSTSETHPAIRTAKASLICLPLFGFPILFVVFRPDTDSCTWEQVYYFISFAMEGLQGVFVGILHCYIDKEVIRLISRTCLQVTERLNICQSRGLTNKRTDPRTTQSTFASVTADNLKKTIQIHNDPELKVNSSNIPVKLNEEQFLKILQPENECILEQGKVSASLAQKSHDINDSFDNPICNSENINKIEEISPNATIETRL